MKRGPKPLTPAEKEARGTVQPVRDRDRVQIVEPAAMPVMPDWLTAEGQEVWLDDLGRVQANRLVTERDSTAFGNYCNLQGMIVRCWRAGKEAPPITALAEARKMMELFGISGAKSRVSIKPTGSDGGNPFARNGKRS